MDEVVRKVAALGLPGVLLVVTMATTGLVGAAAITEVFVKPIIIHTEAIREFDSAVRS
jgi:hypothetical protein